MIKIADIIEFWYSERIKKQWFNSTPELDSEIREKFEKIWFQACDGHLSNWKNTAQGCLALAIVYDQFPLNMYRGQSKSFATEKQAIEISHFAIKQELIAQLPSLHQAFLFMPLMHSEDINDQNLSVEMFKKYALDSFARFSRHHRDLIKRFGRFPHRNKILERKNTPQEEAYLQSPEAFLG